MGAGPAQGRAAEAVGQLWGLSPLPLGTLTLHGEDRTNRHKYTRQCQPNAWSILGPRGLRDRVGPGGLGQSGKASWRRVAV